MDTDSFSKCGPLSPCQEVLLHQELSTGIPQTITRVAQIVGDLDIPAFLCAANRVISDHEPLRSVWELHEGQSRASVGSAANLPCATQIIDVANDLALVTGLKEAFGFVFSASAPPHMRHWIFRRGERDYIWVFRAHHIAADAVSLKLYSKTFTSMYAGRYKPSIPSTSTDYAAVQREWLESASGQAELEWWLRRLKGIPKGRLPVKAPPGSSAGKSQRQEFRLTASYKEAVISTARQHQVPVAAIFLAAYILTADRRYRSTTHCVFANFPGRNLKGGFLASGAFYNHLPLVVTVARSPLEMIKAAAEALYEVLDHQGTPLPLINQARMHHGELPLREIAPVTFNVVENPLADFQLPGCSLWEVSLATLGRPRWSHSRPFVLLNEGPPMDWLVNILPSSLLLCVQYSVSYADPEDVRMLINEYEENLRSLCIDHLSDDEPGQESSSAGLIADWAAAHESEKREGQMSGSE